MDRGELTDTARGGRRTVVTVLGLVALGPPAIAAVVLAVLRPEDAPWGLALGAALFLALALGLARAGRLGSALALTVLLAPLLWPELALRAAGFRFNPAGVVQFGYPRPEQFVGLERDPELFWKLSTSRAEVNSEGFLGREFEIPKPPGTLRLVFFGDSCTYQGYPGLVAGRLNEDREALRELVDAPEGEVRAQAVNLGIPGYTSHQGRIVAERWARALEPDVGLIFFGWNDHWLAYGAIDSRKRTSSPSPSYSHLVASSRLLQWLESLRGSARGEPSSEVRVPIAEYRENLRAIADRIRAAGGRALLVTAPTALYVRGVPRYNVERGFAVSEESLLALHEQYNEAVRELAREEGIWLLDGERLASESPDLERYFGRDGIHFTEEGLRWFGDLVVGEVRRLLAGG